MKLVLQMHYLPLRMTTILLRLGNLNHLDSRKIPDMKLVNVYEQYFLYNNCNLDWIQTNIFLCHKSCLGMNLSKTRDEGYYGEILDGGNPTVRWSNR